MRVTEPVESHRELTSNGSHVCRKPPFAPIKQGMRQENMRGKGMSTNSFSLSFRDDSYICKSFTNF